MSARIISTVGRTIDVIVAGRLVSHLRFAAGVCVLAAALLMASAGGAVAVADPNSSGSAAHGDGGPRLMFSPAEISATTLACPSMGPIDPIDIILGRAQRIQLTNRSQPPRTRRVLLPRRRRHGVQRADIGEG